MQTKYLCVLIHIWTKGEVGAPWNRFKPSSKIFYWPFQGGTSFVDLLCFFCLVVAMPFCVSVHMCLVVTCWERADLLALVCGVYLWVCHFPIGILGQVWDLIVSIPDLCTLTYLSKECVTTIYFSYFSTKTYVVGTQKNRLTETETVFLSTENMLKLMCKKIFTFLRWTFFCEPRHVREETMRSRIFTLKLL